MASGIAAFVRSASRLALRITPWIVSAAALGFGAWVFSAFAPAVYGNRLASVLSAVIALRLVASLGAIAAGSFAVARGVTARWLDGPGSAPRRTRGLITLGAASVATGAFITVGPFLGIGIAHSIAVVGASGLLAAATAWSAWSLRARPPVGPLADQNAERSGPPELLAPNVATRWLERGLEREPGRVNTPVT